MRVKSISFGTACFLALLLTASASFDQTTSILQVSRNIADSAPTETRGTIESSLADVRASKNDIPAEAEDELFCKVIMVPIKGPGPAIHLMQSTEQFHINAEFNTDVTWQQRAVIQQAINEWETIIETRGFTPANYPITFSNGPLAGLTLGVTIVYFYEPPGDLISAEIVFDNDGSSTWFVDPTPSDDAEFGGTPPMGTDLLSVARHEIGHAVGFIDTSRVTSFLNADIFDPDRLNIATLKDGGRHTDPDVHINDLMVPGIGTSMRRPISLYPDSALIARAFHYDITMQFVDSACSGIGRGSANDPWNTFAQGISLTPSGNYLLIIPGAYHEMVPLVLSTPMTISAARGANAVIEGP